MSATAPQTSPPSELIGTVLVNRYRIEDVLGAGTMGVVYRAVDQRDGQVCAVKLLKTDAIGDNDSTERFKREAAVLYSLRHPHLLEVRDHGVDEALNQPYLVMELLEGRQLEQMIVDGAPEPRAALLLARQLLSGLAHAHSKGILHRDLKAENIFVAWNGYEWIAKILDFGLAKFDDEKWGPAKKLTMQGAVFGSPAYMSPEQATGSPMDARSDVYSMGIVLYELLTGCWPFEPDNENQMLRCHLLEAPPPLASKRENLMVQPALEAVVQKALAKRPADRFADAGEMLRALNEVPEPGAWIAGQTNVPPQPFASAPPGRSIAASPRRSRLVPLLVVVVLILLGVVGMLMVWRFRPHV